MFSLSIARHAIRASSARIVASTNVRYTSTSTMHDNDPEVLEREKHKNLTGKQGKSAPHDHAPGWNETLATASEADVKADKSTGSPAELQASTVELLRARRSEIEGEDGTGSTTAFYARDEVSGPLSSVQGKEEATITKRRIHQEDGSTDIVEEIEDVQRMTPSEEDVKADRGEI